MASKGSPIRFVSGKYVGKSGWFDDSKIGNETTVPVIVNLSSKGLGDYETTVYRSSIMVETNEAPSSYAEAVLAQCPDVEISMVSTTRKLAKCDVERDPDGFIILFSNMLHTASEVHKAKGSKAVYRKIEFDANDI